MRHSPHTHGQRRAMTRDPELLRAHQQAGREAAEYSVASQDIKADKEIFFDGLKRNLNYLDGKMSSFLETKINVAIGDDPARTLAVLKGALRDATTKTGDQQASFAARNKLLAPFMREAERETIRRETQEGLRGKAA